MLEQLGIVVTNAAPFFHLSGGGGRTLCLQKRIVEVMERIKKGITALCRERQEDYRKMKDTGSENCKINDHDCKWKMVRPNFSPNTAVAFDFKIKNPTK